MATTKLAPGDPGDIADREQKKKEAAALRKVKLKSFTANPPTIDAFGTSTLQWEVTIPPSTDPLVQLGVFVDGRGVPNTGSETVKPNFTHTFELTAAGDFASRSLGKATVAVDFGTCEVQDVAPVAFAAATKAGIEPMFTGSPDLKLKDGGVKVTLGSFQVNVAIPLEIEVPGWFNADMDIDLKLSLFATDRDPGPSVNTRVFAALNSASVDVSWSLLEHLASLGCTGLVQAALEKQAEVFLENLMGPGMAEQLRAAVQSDVDQRLALLNASHPPHPFRLHSMTVSDIGISYRFCPTA